MRLVRKAVEALRPYQVAQDLNIIKLNQNESPFDLPTSLKRRIARRLARAQWNRYPSGRPADLIRELHRHTRHPAEGIVVGNGSNEMIAATMMATCSRGDKVLLVTPSFPVYERVARLLELKIEAVPLDGDFEFDVDRIERQMPGAKLIVLASPNSPTGTVVSPQQVARILRRFKEVVAIDEAYFEFHRKTVQPLIARFGNLLVIRTFSKAFGLAALRLGYLLAQPALAGQVEKVKLPFSVGLFQQTAGQQVLAQVRLVEARARSIVAARDHLFKHLQRIVDIEPIASRANFILFAVHRRSAHGLQQDLYRRGVLIRYFDTPRLESMLRVTIGRPAENRFFLQQLRAAMKQPRGAR